jgi:hypothetical protein
MVWQDQPISVRGKVGPIKTTAQRSLLVSLKRLDQKGECRRQSAKSVSQQYSLPWTPSTQKVLDSLLYQTQGLRR